MQTRCVKCHLWEKVLLFVMAVVSEPGQATAEGDWQSLACVCLACDLTWSPLAPTEACVPRPSLRPTVCACCQESGWQGALLMVREHRKLICPLGIAEPVSELLNKGL